MFNYAGNPANYPANIGLVDDADLNPATAAALDVAGQNLADRTAWLHANSVLATGGTITGVLTFSSTSAVDFQAGAVLVLEASALLEIESGATLQVDNGGAIHLIGGAAMTVDATGTIVLLGSGGLVAEVAGAIETTAVSGIRSLVTGGIQLSGGSTDVVTFATPHIKDSVQPMMLPVSGVASTWNVSTSYTGYLVGPGAASPAQNVLLPYTHDGATLALIRLQFLVFDAHAGGEPAKKVTVDIRRLDLQAGGAPADVSLGGGPQAIPTGGSGAAWHASGNLQTFAYTCSANNVIENSRYLYYAVITDEDGANRAAGNEYYSWILHHTAIPDMRFAL